MAHCPPASCGLVMWVWYQEGGGALSSSEIITNLLSEAQLFDGCLTNICTKRVRSEVKLHLRQTVQVKLVNLEFICFGGFFCRVQYFGTSSETA